MGKLCERGANSAQEDNDGHKQLRSASECVHGKLVECLRDNVAIYNDGVGKYCVEWKGSEASGFRRNHARR
jgi:hypothetical protein